MSDFGGRISEVEHPVFKKIVIFAENIQRQQNMALIYAEKLEQIYRAFRNEPISAEDMDRFYRDATAARGEPTRKKIKRLLEINQDTNEHILLVGYKGCGKSTELNLLEKELAPQFLTMNISVQTDLDPVHVQYIELFIATMEQLFQKAEAQGLHLNDKVLQSVQDWTKTTEIEEIRGKYFDAELEAGGGYDIKWFVNFFAKFRLAAKTSQSLKKTLKDVVEPRLSDLIGHCNTLIREVRLRLKEIGKNDLLLIFEDLDKIPIDRAQDLFYNYTSQLTQLQVNIIYTFPVALYYNLKFNQIKPYFTQCYELPMIKVRNKDGAVNEEGMRVMRNIIAARMDLNLFEDAKILEDMILISGGVLRDLFLLIGEAAANADVYERPRIGADDWNKAYLRLKRDYDNNIADNRINDKQFYPAENYYKVLADLAQNPQKQVEHSEEVMHLRQNLCILGYNGENWYDVHPIVRDILSSRGKL